jgi:hypothetical protein
MIMMSGCGQPARLANRAMSAQSVSQYSSRRLPASQLLHVRSPRLSSFVRANTRSSSICNCSSFGSLIVGLLPPCVHKPARTVSWQALPRPGLSDKPRLSYKGPNTDCAYRQFWDNLERAEVAMPRTPYLTIIVSAIILGIASEILIISNHGANPFADISRLIVGSIMRVILIMIALLLFFFMYTRMSNR